MHLRLYQPGDISAITSIEAYCSSTDPLRLYLTCDINKNWLSYRQYCMRFLKMKLLESGTICWVIETDVGDLLDSSEDSHEAEQTQTSGEGGEVVGFSIWTRHGTSPVARNWQKVGDGWERYLESCLLLLSLSYYNSVSPIPNDAHRQNLNTLFSSFGASPDPSIVSDYWVVDALYISPTFQRRGLGTRLLKWGLEQADEEGIPVLVDSSPEGRWIYERAGFRKIKKWEVEGWFDPGDRGMWRLLWEPAKKMGIWYDNLVDEKVKEMG
ncbi:MAG: hypothetical protein MMC33_003701 [Icmadophila ericetorum]|nr:hypothetical protein [Icmadophila ericetorum]